MQQQTLKNLFQNTLGKSVEMQQNSEKPKGRNIFHGKAKPTEKQGDIEVETNIAADVAHYRIL